MYGSDEHGRAERENPADAARLDEVLADADDQPAQDVVVGAAQKLRERAGPESCAETSEFSRGTTAKCLLPRDGRAVHHGGLAAGKCEGRVRLGGLLYFSSKRRRRQGE